MNKPEPCTNYHGTRRHMSTTLTTSKYRKGREGRSLCSPGGMPVDVYDQEAIDSLNAQWGAKMVVVADIQACRNCERSAAKLESQP